jgi:anti-sigma B factor antagonist
MDVSIETRKADADVIVMDVAGRLAAGETGQMFRGELQRCITEGSQRFLINLGKVSYIDSSGLGELITSHNSLRNRGGAVKLLNPTKRIRDLLQMTKLLGVFEIYEDEAAAVQSFRS